MELVCVRGITSALVLLLSAVAALAQPRQVEAPPKGPTTFAVSKARSAVKVDGVLDEAAWGSAAVVPVAYEWAPGDNIPAPVTTQCLVTFDTKNLYVAFRAADPRPAEIRAHLMDRDDVDTLIQDDHVGLMIDTFNDERRAFQFRVNPLGVQADAIFSEQDGVEDFSWDMIWSSAGRVTEDGYVVEIYRGRDNSRRAASRISAREPVRPPPCARSGLPPPRPPHVSMRAFRTAAQSTERSFDRARTAT